MRVCCPLCFAATAMWLFMPLLHQTRGAVRDSTKLAQAAFWYKIYIAAAAAAAEQSFELSLLNTALSLLQTSLLDALPTVWTLSGQGATRDAFDAEQMRNATCLCGSSVRAPLTGTPHYSNEATFLSDNCTGKQLHSVKESHFQLVTCTFDMHMWLDMEGQVYSTPANHSLPVHRAWC